LFLDSSLLSRFPLLVLANALSLPFLLIKGGHAEALQETVDKIFKPVSVPVCGVHREPGFDRLYPFHALMHTAVTNVYRASRDLFLA